MVSSLLFLLSAVSAQDFAPLAPLPGKGDLPSASLSSSVNDFEATRQDVDAHESRHLVLLGAVLAATCIFSGVILGFLLLASVAGLAMPLMGALPSTSAALFAMQVLAAVGFTEAPPALKDLGVPLGWMAPRPDSVLVGCILVLAFVWLARRTAVRLHRKNLGPRGVAQLPHGLSPGSWELRALGLVAFPLAAASTQLVASLDQADSAVAGLVVSSVILCFLANQAALAFCFVRRVLDEGTVKRTLLPELGRGSGGHEVFIDKLCDELRALPLGASPPGQAMSDWLGTSGWCVAPPVALIEETEWSDEAHDTFRERMAHASPVSEDGTWQKVPDSLDDELQDQPLLEAKSEAAVSDVPTSLPEPQVLFRGGASVVKEFHPLTVKSTVCFDGPAREACAGVACLPWLDCAVPSSALQRVEDVSGSVTLRVHPSQLAGKLSSGHYAACFDWGTKSPWRWPLDLAAQVLLGLWVGLQRSGRQVLPAAGQIVVDAITLAVLAGLVLCFFKVSAWEHWIDNLALRSAYLMVLEVVSLKVMWDPLGKHALEVPAAVLAAGLVLVPVSISLLSGVCLVGVALGRLETQGLWQDRMLQMSVAGWADATRESEERNFSGFCDVQRFPRGSSRDVEVVLPGSRKAFAILLPGRSRLRIQHLQLLPPAMRGAEVRVLHGADGSDRPRLPLPPWFLFAPEGKGAFSLEAEASPAPPGVVPLAALLSPGHPGMLIYAEACHNRDDADWRQAVLGFFRDEGGALAEEALCHIAAAQEHSDSHPCLVVVEVLPSLASEFMDDRCQVPDDV